MTCFQLQISFGTGLFFWHSFGALPMGFLVGFLWYTCRGIHSLFHGSITQFQRFLFVFCEDALSFSFILFASLLIIFILLSKKLQGILLEIIFLNLKNLSSIFCFTLDQYLLGWHCRLFCSHLAGINSRIVRVTRTLYV